MTPEEQPLLGVAGRVRLVGELPTIGFHLQNCARYSVDRNVYPKLDERVGGGVAMVFVGVTPVDAVRIKNAG